MIIPSATFDVTVFKNLVLNLFKKGKDHSFIEKLRGKLKVSEAKHLPNIDILLKDKISENEVLEFVIENLKKPIFIKEDLSKVSIK